MADNTKDAIDRRRFACGERSPRAKITRAQAEEIRALGKSRALTQRALAERFGIGQARINDIIHGKSWVRV